MQTLIKTDQLKEQLFGQLSLGDVAGRLGVDLKTSGQQLVGLCPLHPEDTPSFYINEHRGPSGLYHCFGCKVGGDMIDLVQRVKHLDFPGALEWLAQQAGLDMADFVRPMTEAEQQQERLREWCEQWLAMVDHMGRSPIAVQDRFGTGLPMGRPPELPSYLQDKEYLLSGDVLPWRLPNGRLVGWRVREKPGYQKSVVGTPNDFPLGKITDTLFGIQVAREHLDETNGNLVVVEGEYDAMALYSFGVRSAVAMGGTSFTEAQMRLAQSLHVRGIVFLLDGDEAGRQAAVALAQKYWDHDVPVSVAICPEGHDPESLLLAHGDMPVWVLYEQAPAALEFLLRQEWDRRGRETLTEKLDFVRWVREHYGKKLVALEQSLVLQEVARWLHIPEVDVRDFVRSEISDLTAPESERALFGQAMRDRDFFLQLRAQLSRDDFFLLKHQRLWDALSEMLIDGLEFDLLTIQQQVQKFGIAQDYVSQCLDVGGSRNLQYHVEKVVDLSLRRSTRDTALLFKDRVTDLQRPAEVLVGELTHEVTSKALRKTGVAQRQLAEQVDEAMDILHQRMRNPSEVHGLDLGGQYPKLARTLQGLQPRRLVLLAATSGVGKSTMLITWAGVLAVHQSMPVDFVSLEMDETEILYKLASHMTGIDSMLISGGALQDEQAQRVEQAMLRIRKSPLKIWAPDGLSGSEFLLYARESVMRRRTQAFFLDYVQLVDPESGQEAENGYKQFGDFGRLVKMKVARAMEVSVVCCAQLNRGAAAKERATKEDMGDSYALVRHSDVIVILQGNEDSSTMHVWVDKNRQGQADVLIPTVYDRAINTFHEASGSLKLPEYALL